MSTESRYWRKKVITRRSVLRGAAVAGGGLATLSLIGCGSGNGGTGGSKKPDAGKETAKILDPASGKRGGKLVWQGYGDPGAGLELVKARSPGVQQLGSLTHDGLLEYQNGIAGYDGMGLTVQPNLAQALPEQSPDKLSYTFKLRPAKFHNGRAVNSEDVKYSFDRDAFGADSAVKIDWPWLDKVATPDPQTVVITTKYPYADALQSFAERNFNFILCKEHEESAEHEKKLMGSGPYLFVSYEPPLLTRYKRNPEYHRQPYPYFDEIDRLGTSDPEKKVADFSSKQVHTTYWFAPEERDRVKKARPDALVFNYPSAGSSTLYMRSDKPPFNDKRIRQALSMAIDRKALTAGVFSGEGEPDQSLSWSGTYWKFRKPAELGAAAKYWNFDVAESKKLLAAAGVTLPLKFELPHWDPTVIGQKFVDAAVLIEAHWRTAGIADVKDVNLTFGQVNSTLSIGKYDPIYWGSNVTGVQPAIGIEIRNKYFSPPEGIKEAPTLNVSWINNQTLSGLAEKQMGVFEREARIQVFRGIEDILAEEQYHVVGVSGTAAWFMDPSLKNAQWPRDAYNGGTSYMKYWWFDKA